MGDELRAVQIAIAAVLLLTIEANHGPEAVRTGLKQLPR
jgi:hypothetical protein